MRTSIAKKSYIFVIFRGGGGGGGGQGVRAAHGITYFNIYNKVFQLHVLLTLFSPMQFSVKLHAINFTCMY